MLKSITLLSCLFIHTSASADSTPITNGGTLSYISTSDTPSNKNIAAVNINTAQAEQLATSLIGVGAKKARDIVLWRRQFGPFKHIYQLTEVKGIGEKTVDKNKHKIRLK